MLVFRYLSREVFTTLFATTLILLAIMMSNQVIKILNGAAIGHFTMMAVLQLMSIQVPVLLGYMLPMGLFLSILLMP